MAKPRDNEKQEKAQTPPSPGEAAPPTERVPPSAAGTPSDIIGGPQAPPEESADDHALDEQPQLDGPYIVGVGASAGGLEPLQQFFHAMTDNKDVAFVVIQHLSPDYKSLMKELLSRHTAMTVHRVEDGMEIQAGCVYLIPPKHNLIVEGKCLRLVEQDARGGHGPNFPIDVFFTSLADAVGERAISVILSGTGTDGTRGIRRINERGGVVLVQSPDSAQFDGMPRSAISTGLVHYVLPPEEIAQAIHDYVHNIQTTAQIAEGAVRRLGSRHLAEIADILKREDGLDFSYFKTTTLGRRIERRMVITHHDSLDDYIECLRDSTEERTALRRDLLISVTSFMRDPDAWSLLGNRILPEVVQSISPSEHFRAWVTACATGEEVYSLAMLVAENLEAEGRHQEVKIFATDVDTQALEHAAAGIYPETIASEIGIERLKRFFTKNGDHYQVSRRLREMVIFAPHDLTRDAPFTRMNMVLCRNVLIYMQPEMQDQVLAMLHFSLRASGTLFLGAAESVGDLQPEFRTLSQKWKIFQKRRDVRLPLSRRRRLSGKLDPPSRSAVEVGGPPVDARADTVVTEAFGAYLSERNAMALVIDTENNLLHSFGNTTTYLHLPQGQGTLDVTRMLPRTLALHLHTALHRVRKEPGAVCYNAVRLDSDELDQQHLVDVRVSLNSGGQFLPESVLILVEPSVTTQATHAVTTSDLSSQAAQRIKDLESELQQTKENLQATIEELETTNEEQQATNEELLASNEELQSTNEELHSVNEELHTVNAEYQTKIQELVDLNNDIDNLLSSTDIGTIFLDNNLAIRKFTPAATRVINLVPHDVGRPFEHLSHSLVDIDLTALIQSVRSTGEFQERQVRTTKAEEFLVRAHPYRTDEGDAEGVVLTFVDVSDLRRAEAELELMADLIESSQDAIIRLTPNGAIAYWNPAATAFFGRTESEALGEDYHDLLPNALAAKVKRIATAGETAASGTPLDIRVTDANGYDIDLSVVISIVHDPSRRPVGISIIAHDITDRRRAELESQRYARLVRDSYDAIIVFNADARVTGWNSGAERMYGYSYAHAITLTLLDLVPEGCEEEAKSVFQRALSGEDIRSLETQRRTKDGRTLSVWITVSVTAGDEQNSTFVCFTERDITAVKQAEERLRRNEALLNDTQKIGGLGGWELDLETNVVHWTDHVRRLREVDEDYKPTTDNWLSFYEGSDRELIESTVARARRDGTPWDLELRSVTGRGRRRWVRSSGEAVLRDGKVVKLRGVLQDVTERRLAEDALRRIEWLLSRKLHDRGARLLAPSQEEAARHTCTEIVDAVGRPVLEDIVGNFLDLLDTASVVYERSGEMAVGVFASGWCHYLAQASPGCGGTQDLNANCSHTCWNHACLEAMDRSASVDLPCQGSLQLHAVPIYADDEVVGAISFGYGDPPQDHDELKSLADRFNLPLDDLVRHARNYQSRPPFIIDVAKRRLEVAARMIGVLVERSRVERERAEVSEQLRKATRELEQRNVSLQQANAEIEAFVYSASHDLRSPLINLQGFSDRLQQCVEKVRHQLDGDDMAKLPAVLEARTLLDDDASKSLQRISNSVVKFSSVIDGLLRLSRTGRDEYQIETVDMQTTAERVVEALSNTIEERKVTVEIERLPDARGDEAAITRVLANLLSNALNYLDDKRPGHVAIGCSGQTETVNRYFVRDNGIGIAPAQREKIFRIFQRLNPKKAPGEGLGLAIVKKIVERHCGEITVDSVPGEGTTFFFTLPRPTTEPNQP